MDLLNTTGKRIRVLRNDLGLTQGEVMQQLESVGVAVDRSYLSILERTDRVPNGEVIAGENLRSNTYMVQMHHRQGAKSVVE